MFPPYFRVFWRRFLLYSTIRWITAETFQDIEAVTLIKEMLHTAQLQVLLTELGQSLLEANMKGVDAGQVLSLVLVDDGFLLILR